MTTHDLPLKTCLSTLFLSAVLAFGLEAAESTPLPVHIVVNVDKPGVTVSPLLYGIFFEEINHAGDGGIYAEMVQNRSFEEPGKAKDPFPAWEVVTENGGEGTAKLETAQPMSELNPHYLVLRDAWAL